MIDRLLRSLASWLLTFIGRRKWRVTAVLMPALVAELGPLGAIRWMMKNTPGYDRAVEELGGLRGNLVFALASLFNGCGYCLYAHARAFELYYFKEHRRLFSIDEQAILGLLGKSDDEIRSEIEAALTEGGLSAEIATLRRLYALKLEDLEPTAADRHLVHAIQMYDLLNFCSISSQAPLDDAHDPININHDLKLRYAEARLEARGLVTAP